MSLIKPNIKAVYCGVVATMIGLIAFTISWNTWELWNGPLPGYQFFLFPGNLSLIYFWHPIFTEEVNLWPKLLMLLSGQFFVTTSVVVILSKAIKHFKQMISY